MKCVMTHARHQAGFALIEVIVSAAVLAIVALAVFSGIDGATASTARERARAVAASLAEQDQERLRSYRFDELTKLVGAAGIDRKLNVDGVNYNVNSAGHAPGRRRHPDHGLRRRRRQAVRVPAHRLDRDVGDRRRPASHRPRLESLVAPPVSGSLVVKVLTARNVGVRTSR